MHLLVYLAWPEKCFRVSAEDLRFLKSLLPAKATIANARSESAFLRHLPRATHVLTWHFKREWYRMAPNLRLVSTPAAGRELVSDAAPRGVRVSFGAFHGEAIAESVVGFMLAKSRGFFDVPRAPMRWPRTWLSDKCHTIAGSHAVILGYGHIGRAIARKLEALGARVTGISRHPPTDFKTQASQLKTADWLILALPATSETNDILSARLIARLPRRCVVINIGRGNAVDEAALVAALKTGRLAGAYLDVVKNEPTLVNLKTKESAIDPMKDKIPNLVLMPHSSAFRPDYMKVFFLELKNEGLI